MQEHLLPRESIVTINGRNIKDNVDELKEAITKTVANYERSKSHAAQLSSYLRERYSWDECASIVASSIGAVSYTHLDVYKRQFIRTLEAISPENENSFYHSQYFEDFNDKSSFSLSNSWLNLAKEIDYSARILIEMCLRSSANEIIEGEVDYFALADLLNVDIPTMKVIRFTLQNSEISEADKKMSETKERIERLQTRKSHLERFIYLSDTMKQEIEKELINLGVK